MELIHSLVKRHSAQGIARWMGVRPARRKPVVPIDSVRIELDGLNGDRRQRPGKRAITLIQWEHLPVIAALSGHDSVEPATLRRNIAVSGLNLLALRKSRFRIGTVLLQGTGLCAPCARMEEALGRGGFSAMRGHGGITAEVVKPGFVSLGDSVVPVDLADPD